MAVIAQQSYKIDLTPQGGYVIVYVSQHDNEARGIVFKIYNQGKVFDIPANVNVSVQGVKSNGGYFTHNCTYSGNLVTMPIADDMTDVVGKAICVLKFTNASEKKLATAKFILNVDSDSSSEGIIIDTVAEEIFDQLMDEIRAQAAIININIATLQSMVGTPLLASTVSAMTDHNKIYVYTGSESGYTYGNWYYWDDTEWQSGGQYNSVPIVVDQTPTSGSTNPVSSNGVYTSLGNKVDKVTGKGLSTEDYTTAEKTKLAGLTQVEVDDTLSVEGRAADAKKTGDKITGLKEDLNAIKAVTVNEVVESTTTNIRSNLTWEDGNMNLSGGVGTGTDKRHSDKIEVSEGDIIAYQNSNFLFNYVTAFNGDTAVSEKGVINVNSYTVPSGVTHLVLSEYTSRGTAAINHTTTVYHYENILDNDIVEIKSNIEDVNNAFDAEVYTDETITNIFPDITWTSGYMDKSGVTMPSSEYRYSNKIAVSIGDVVSFQNANFTFRFITAFSGESTAVSASGASDTNSYTVPEGINYVVLSEYVSRGTAAIIQAHYETKTAYNIKPIPLGYMLESGSLANGERLTLPYMQVKNFNRIIFNANITTFSSVRYSLGTAKVEVNATNLLITNANGTVLNPIPHGLTIGKNMTLLIETETEEYINHVRISSDGAVFDYNTKFFAQSVNSSQYIESVGSALTECVLSWVSQNVNAPVWIFGDSYLSWYPERWTYYLAQDEYVKNTMINGFAGQGSSTAYTALVNLLNITTPKIVVWCLGMNDPDTESAVNEAWFTYYEKIKELQKKHAFELVLYTVPTTPTMNNNFKNSIVRNSGFRYIEADKAVRIDNDGHWVSNALDVDNVHPTAIGGKILYYRILADLPEIMCSR